MARSCAGCGRAATTKWCSEACRKRFARANGGAVVDLAVRPDVRPDVSCMSATLLELEAAGRESTALGRACLALATRIDAGRDTGSALAGAVKQLEASLSAVLRGATVAASPLDELRARRDAKRGA